MHFCICLTHSYPLVPCSFAADVFRAGTCGYDISLAYFTDGEAYGNGNITQVHTYECAANVKSRVSFYMLHRHGGSEALEARRGKGAACLRHRNYAYRLSA